MSSVSYSPCGSRSRTGDRDTCRRASVASSSTAPEDRRLKLRSSHVQPTSVQPVDARLSLSTSAGQREASIWKTRWSNSAQRWRRVARFGGRLCGSTSSAAPAGAVGRRSRWRGRPFWAAPAVASLPGAPGAWLVLLPPVFGSARAPKVDCKPGPVPTLSRLKAGEDHSSRRRIAAPLERSYPDASGCVSRRGCFGRATLDSVPIRACSGRGLPRRRSPGCRAWALTPRFHPYLCLRSVSSQSPSLNGHRRCIFCGAFPRVTPGRR